MENLPFDEYMKSRYEDQLGYYNQSASKNQKKYNYYQWTIIILSTVTTIMAALPSEWLLKYVVVITSGIVTVITAALKTFKYEELWVNYRKTAEKLKPEKYFFKFNIGKYGKEGVNKEVVFVETIEDILNKEQAAWLGLKKSGMDEREQMLAELQGKIDILLREQFKTQRPNPTEDEEKEPPAGGDENNPPGGGENGGDGANDAGGGEAGGGEASNPGETDPNDASKSGAVPSAEEIKKILTNDKAENEGETEEPLENVDENLVIVPSPDEGPGSSGSDAAGEDAPKKP